MVIGVDRAGLVGEDGETHQGLFDVPFLRTIPHLQVLSPASFSELRRALRWALEQREGPVAIRYPKGSELEFREDTFDHPQAVLQEGKDITLVSYGIMINQVLEATISELERSK